MAFVREESDRVMSRVKSNEAAERRRVEEYATKIQMKRGHLVGLTRSCINFLSNSNIVEICSKREEKKSDLEALCSEKAANLAWSMENLRGKYLLPPTMFFILYTVVFYVLLMSVVLRMVA